MFKHILIPTDGSELSAKAAQAGVAMAKRLGAKVTGVYVLALAPPLSYGEPAWVDEGMLQQMRESAQLAGNKYLDRMQSVATVAQVPFERSSVQSDAPWLGILETAKNKGCDFIVMAAHGRRGLAALVLGSETNKVLTHSKIPVLVYR